MPRLFSGDQQHFETVGADTCACQMLHQYNFRSLSDQFTRCCNGLVDIVHRMLAQNFEFNQIRGNNVTSRERMAYMKFRHSGCDNTPLFRVSHHRIAKVFCLRVCRFYLANNTQNMLALFC